MRFIAGDELGNLKILRVEEKKITQKFTRAKTSGKQTSVQALGTATVDGDALVAAAYADGSACAFRLQSDDTLEEVEKWTEPRLKADARYVGISATERGVFSCTSNGALRKTPVQSGSEASKTISLPTRLYDWRLSKNQETFAYGGDEVELSVWSTEKAFSTAPEPSSDPLVGKKRKRDALFPGETWRAKNVPNDNLGLRKPVRITSLTYIRSSDGQLLAGTQLGSVRRYDTRAAKRPVADWSDVAKIAGVKTIESGFNENEAFVSDGGSNLFSLDLRNGRISYAYKGISGAISSIAPSTSLMASVGQDRFARIHSVFPPPSEVGKQQEQKGEVLDKMYMQIAPTVIAWDQCASQKPRHTSPDNDDEDVWKGMEEIGEGSDDEIPRRRKLRAQ